MNEDVDIFELPQDKKTTNPLFDVTQSPFYPSAEQIAAAQKRETEGPLLTPAQAAYIGSVFAPGAGIADAAGKFPEFPGKDVDLIDAFSGDPLPSIAENIAAGGIDRYLVAPLQGLGVVGDALYATPVVGPVLGPTVGSVLKGVGGLSAVAAGIGKAKKSKAGIGALDESKAIQTSIKQNIDKFAKDQYGFVSPSLEALIKSAPPNLKGKQITEWLAANANKGVKPKELEYLGIDEFVAANPKATINQVVEGVGDNKVVVGKNTYYHNADAPEIDFDISTPELDPLDGSPLHQFETENLLDAVRSGDEFEIEQVVDSFNLDNPQANAKTIDEIENFLKTKGEDFEDYIDNIAKARYQQDPYELIKPKSTNEVFDVDIADDTFAFGNDEVGYQLFVGGKRVTDPDNVAFSRTEAQIQLANKMEEGGDPLRIAGRGDEDMFAETRYKQYVDETLPGGDNYREVVFTWENAPVEHGVQDHFDELSQISSALIRNRKLADGKKTLHVDELQSDLHTKGSRDGYSTPELDMDDTIKLGRMSSGISMEFKKLKDRILPKLENSSLDTNRLENIKTQIANAEELYAKSPQDRFSLIRMNDARRSMYDALATVDVKFANMDFDVVSRGQKFDFSKFDEAFNPALKIAQAKSARVPNYPFKDDWYAMSLKQLLKDAIDEGADAISVSSSAPIKARYTAEYSKFYETLYDQKIPSAMKKLANKYGGKFEKGGLDEIDTFGSQIDDIRKGDTFAKENLRNLFDDSTAMADRTTDEIIDGVEKTLKTNIIRITPEMKAKILEEGLSSFAFGGPVNRLENLVDINSINIFED
mgnify:FL=1